MIRPIEDLSELPGQTLISPRRHPGAVPLAVLLGAAWPPLILTLPIWPPANWMPALDMDWRLLVLAVGLLAVPAGLWAVTRERERNGRPATRLGVVWRFMLYGGLLSGGLQTILALFTAVAGGLSADGAGQAAGFAETALLIFGVGFLPVAIVVGVSYALWAGLCVAFIAFQPRRVVRDRLGVMASIGSDQA